MERRQIRPEALPIQHEQPAFTKIPGTQHETDELTEDRSVRGSADTHSPCEDGQRIADDVDQGAGEHGCHGVLRTAVSPDDRGHSILRKRERHHSVNDESVITRKRDRVLGGSQAVQELIAQTIAEQRDQQTAKKRADDRIRDRARDRFLVIFSCAHAQICGCSVAEQQRDAPAHDRDRKDDACGGIAQIPDPVTDEDLVDDVVKTGNNQRKDARQCKSTQQPADPFCS